MRLISVKIERTDHNDESFRKRIRTSIKDLCAKPEVAALLEEAYRLHGKPLTINATYTPDIRGAHYNVDDHEINIDPRVLRFEDEGKLPNHQWESDIAHEMGHAIQEDSDGSQKYYQLIDDIQKKIERKTIPWEKYHHRIRSAEIGDRLEAVFAEIYDCEVAPFQESYKSQCKKAWADSPEIQRGFEKVEKGPIEFSNLIGSKYYGVKPRSTNPEDYSSFGTKEKFIERNSMREIVDRMTEKLRRHQQDPIRKLERVFGNIFGEEGSEGPSTATKASGSRKR